MRRFMGEHGIVAIIIRTMENYPDDEIVQLHACTTLTNLFHNSLENRSRYGCIYIYTGSIYDVNGHTYHCMLSYSICFLTSIPI